MTVEQLFNQARDILQDTDKNYWSDSELIDYINSGIRNIASRRKESPTTVTIGLATTSNEYSVNDVLRYISIKDSNNNDRPIYLDDGTGDDDEYGVIIQDYNMIYVNTPLTGVSLHIKAIKMPEAINLSTDIRSGDENALKYYIVSKAYEKEQDTENFQKVQYFMIEFEREVKELLKRGSINYISNVQTTKGYYY